MGCRPTFEPSPALPDIQNAGELSPSPPRQSHTTAWAGPILATLALHGQRSREYVPFALPSPGYAITAILVLAIGIAGITSIFTIVDAALLPHSRKLNAFTTSPGNFSLSWQ